MSLRWYFVFEQLNYTKTRVFHAILLPVIIEFSRYIGNYSSAKFELETYTFMPKQVTGDNRVIPYQLYYDELKKILENAENYLPFLKESDEQGISNKSKLLSIFEFRIPYYVGPLCEASKYAWLTRKAEGKIYPWNFENKVDLDQSEDEFINRMTNNCSYLPGETVLPQNSLLYSKRV